jgi:hypothetical protein
MFQNLIDILTSPSAAFARLKEKPTILFPLLLVLISATSVQAGYILLTDRGFLVDQQLEQVETMFPQITSEQLDVMEEQMLGQSATVMILNAVISVSLLLLVVLALYALYLKFASKFSFVDLGWKHWFSMLCWTSVPTVFGALASWVVLLSSSNGQVPITGLNPLSFTSLLGLSTQSGPLAQLTPLYIWSFVLLALGYQHWTKKGLVASALISLAPYVLIFGIWGFFSL